MFICVHSYLFFFYYLRLTSYINRLQLKYVQGIIQVPARITPIEIHGPRTMIIHSSYLRHDIMAYQIFGNTLPVLSTPKLQAPIQNFVLFK